MKGKGQYVIVCRKHSEEPTIAGKIYIPPSLSNDDFFEAVIVHGGMDMEDYGLNTGDRILVRNTNAKIKIGKNKEGDIYAVEYDDIICSLEPDDDSTVFA